MNPEGDCKLTTVGEDFIRLDSRTKDFLPWLLVEEANSVVEQRLDYNRACLGHEECFFQFCYECCRTSVFDETRGPIGVASPAYGVFAVKHLQDMSAEFSRSFEPGIPYLKKSQELSGAQRFWMKGLYGVVQCGLQTLQCLDIQ